MNTKGRVNTNLMKALAHPLRQRILTALNQRVASPSELAEELGEPLGNVSYHVRMLVDLGCIELVSTTPRRGALEHHYRATAGTLLDDATYASFPLTTRRSVVGEILKDTWQSVGEAVDAGTFDDDDVHLTREQLALDAEGWDEITALLAETFGRVQEIKEESAKRLAKAGEDEPQIDSWMSIMHYRSGTPFAKVARRVKPKARRRPAPKR